MKPSLRLFSLPILSALVLFGVCLHSAAWAQADSGVGSLKSDEALAADLDSYHQKRGISVGYQYGYVEYQEPGLMKEFGSLNGINASYDWILTDKFIRFEGEYLAGRIQYDGAYQDGTPVQSGSKDFILNMRGMMNWGYNLSSVALMNWYTGLGFRSLNDRIEGQGGYQREISYVYLPFGLTWNRQLNSGWSVAANAEYDVFFVGNVKSHLSDVHPSYPDVQNTQTDGMGARLNMSVRKDFVTYAIKVQPYFQYWHIKDSDYQLTVDEKGRSGYVYEPENTSKMFGLNVMAEI